MKHKFAWDKFKNIVPILKAIKGNKYYLCGTDIPLIVREGDINTKHYSFKPTGSSNYNLTHDSKESIEHYNTKWGIKEKGYFIYNNTKIVPKTIEVEHYFKNINMACDVVFFDEDDNLMCAIEVYVTHRKSDADISKLKELDTTVYEYNYKNRETELLCWSAASEQIRARVEKSYGRSTKKAGKRNIELKNELLNSKHEFNRESEEIENRIEQLKSKRNTAEEHRRYQEFVERAREGIRTNNLEITRIEKAIRDYEEKKSDIESFNEERERIEKQIRKTRGLIAWQNNRSKQASTICKRGF